jgi:hypothetical protein
MSQDASLSMFSSEIVHGSMRSTAEVRCQAVR